MTACTALSAHLHGLRQADRAILAAMAAHIRTCARCRRGQFLLPADVVLPDSLTLDHRTRLPRLASYYEATHPGYRLIDLADLEIVAVALHLARCEMCGDQFEALCEISEAEEQGVGDELDE